MQRDPVTCCVRRSASSQVLYAAFDCSPAAKWDPYGLLPTIPLPGGIIKCLGQLGECENKLEKVRGEPEVQEWIEKLPRACVPQMVCGVPGAGMCSDPKTGGGMDYGSWTIVMCSSSFTGADLIHELIHASQFCARPGWPEGDPVTDPKDKWKPERVEDWACLEMEAYSCSGQYTSVTPASYKDMIERCRDSVVRDLGFFEITVTHRPDPSTQPGPSTRPGEEPPSKGQNEAACTAAFNSPACNCLKRAQ